MPRDRLQLGCRRQQILLGMLISLHLIPELILKKILLGLLVLLLLRDLLLLWILN
jgi:hypothetical protein